METEYEKFCQTMEEFVNAEKNPNRKWEKENIFEYGKTLNAVIEKCIEELMELRLKYAVLHRELGGVSVYNTYHSFKGAKWALMGVNSRLFSDILKNISSWDEANMFYEWLENWFSNLMFHDSYEKEHGKCCLSLLIRIKKQFIKHIQKKDRYSLERAKIFI